MTALTIAELRKFARAYNKSEGSWQKTAAILGCAPATVQNRLAVAKRRLPKGTVKAFQRRGKAPDPKTLARAVEVRAQHVSIRAAAEAMGVAHQTLSDQLSRAHRLGFRPVGRSRAIKPNSLPLPTGDDIARYILTCAQSDTKLHEPTWTALHALAKHYGARVMVSTFSYNHRLEGTAKRGTQTSDDRGQYDPRIEPHVVDELVALAPSLHFNGHMNILPTASEPLSGLDSYNGRASSVFPHVKQHMKSIATTADSAAKLQFTTGAATQLNYLQKKAGQKAEFDHIFGGLIVEVNSAGRWWARQLNVDNKGGLYDLDLYVTPEGEVVPSIGPAAYVFGDIHASKLDEEILPRWGSGGVIDSLKPAKQVFHDTHDMESRGHHNRRDPLKMFELYLEDRESVKEEVEKAKVILKVASAWSPVLVVDSNHDRHLERWLKECDWKSDPVNAEFLLDVQRAALRHIREKKLFNALAWAVGKVANVRFLEPGRALMIAGTDCSLHGDLGPNGARGSLRNLSKLGRRVMIGHSHGAGILNGAYQVGVTARPNKFDYARGQPSNWSQTDGIVYANGKRTLVTWWKDKWRA